MRNHNVRKVWVLMALTPFFFYATHFFAFFIHEYAHSFSAWLFGFKDNPLLLNFGDTSWENILFFTKIDENVNYDLFSSSHPWKSAFIAFAGLGVGNACLFIISIGALLSKKSHGQWYYYFFIWLAVMNLGNFNDYVPARTFGTHGDIHEIVTSLALSPWWVMLLLGYPICYCFWFFYTKLLPATYQKLAMNNVQKVILLTMMTLTLFAIFGMAGYQHYGASSQLISLLSLYCVPIVMVVCWPTRVWVT